MTPTVPLAGIVLAGGASRRMGRDKATLSVPGWFSGRSLVEHVVSVVARRCAPVFVVAAPGQVLPELSADVLRDEVRGAGPLPATGRGLRAAADAGAQRAFVCAVDMPLLAVELIDALAGETGDADVVLGWDGRDHYLAAVYRTRLAERVEALVAAGAHSMRALVDVITAQRVELVDARMLANINTPDELRTIQQIAMKSEPE